jgi:hypothetical protein
VFDLDDEPGAARLVVSLLPPAAAFGRGIDALVDLVSTGA